MGDDKKQMGCNGIGYFSYYVYSAIKNLKSIFILDNIFGISLGSYLQNDKSKDIIVRIFKDYWILGSSYGYIIKYEKC